jgi:hypothetical protein
MRTGRSFVAYADAAFWAVDESHWFKVVVKHPTVQPKRALGNSQPVLLIGPKRSHPVGAHARTARPATEELPRSQAILKPMP